MTIKSTLFLQPLHHDLRLLVKTAAAGIVFKQFRNLPHAVDAICKKLQREGLQQKDLNATVRATNALIRYRGEIIINVEPIG